MASGRTRSRIRDVLAFVYVGLVPIGWSPFPAQIQWADLLFVGLLVAVLRGQRGPHLRFHALDLFVMSYLAASLISFRSAPDIMLSGLALTKQVYLALVYVVFGMLALERAAASKILSWYAGVAAALAAVSVLALMGYTGAGIHLLAPLLSVGHVPGVGEAVRIKGALLSPGLFCNYLTMALPVLIALAIGSRSGATLWHRVRMLLVAAAGLGTLTYSIAGFLGAGLVSVWRCWGSTRGWRALRAAMAILFIGSFLVGNAMLVISVRDVSWVADENVQVPIPPSDYGFQDETKGAQRLTGSVSYNPMSYALLKRVAVQAFRRAPLTGVGLGTFHAETERAYQQGLLHAPYRRADPHAELLGRLAETGLVGGLTLLLLWWGIARFGCVLLRREPASAWASRAILAGLFGVLVNSLNADVMNFRFVWVGMGLLRGQLK